jgi:hypothetical protein
MICTKLCAPWQARFRRAKSACASLSLFNSASVVLKMAPAADSAGTASR